MNRAVIFANGIMHDHKQIRAILNDNDWIIAADGGTQHVRACGLWPDVVIGDLDSFPSDQRNRMEEKGTQFITHPIDKDETDLELALLYVASSAIDSVLIVGALGGRLDQMLANIQLLALPQLDGLQVQLSDGIETATIVRDQFEIQGKTGDRLSLLPLGGDALGVSISGVSWPLQDETLFFGKARGVSNMMTGDHAQVVVRSGLLLCVHAKSLEY